MSFEWPTRAARRCALIPLAARAAAGSRDGASRATPCASATSTCSRPWRRRRARPGASCRPRCSCAALAALAVGLARPQISISAERKQGTVVLALDRSGSMLAQDVDPDRITASRQAATSFVKNLPSASPVGVVTFSDSADAAAAPSRDKARCRDGDRRHPGRRRHRHRRRDRALARPARRRPDATTPKNSQGPRDPPALGRLEHAGHRPLHAPSPPRSAPACPSTRSRSGRRAACSTCRRSARASAPCPCRPIPEALRAIARDTGGESFTALDEGTLKKVYSHIGTRVSSTKQQKEVTFIVAGAAAALLLAAAASSWALRSHDVSFADPYLLVDARARADRGRALRRARAAQPARAARAPPTPRSGRTSCRAARAGAATCRPPPAPGAELAARRRSRDRRRSLPTDQKETTVVLTVDTSNSMAAKDVSAEPHRRARGPRRACSSRACPRPPRSGIVSFARDVHVLLAPTDDRADHQRLARPPHAAAAARRSAPRSTAPSPRCGPRRSRSRDAPSSSSPTARAPRARAAPVAAARAAKAAGVRVFTVSLGTATGTVTENGKTVTVPPDPTTLQAGRGRRRRAVLPRDRRQGAQQRLREDRQRGPAAPPEARHQLRLHRRRRRRSWRRHPALAGLVPPPDLTSARLSSRQVRGARSARRRA